MFIHRMNEKSEIQRLMEEITNLKIVPVFSVTLSKPDHSEKWTAHATLRADSRHVSISHDEPEYALRELKRVLLLMICPYCERLMDMPDDGKLFEGSGLVAGVQSGGV